MLLNKCDGKAHLTSQASEMVKRGPVVPNRVVLLFK